MLKQVTFTEANIGDLIYISKGSAKPVRVIAKTDRSISLEEPGSRVRIIWTFRDTGFDQRERFIVER